MARGVRPRPAVQALTPVVHGAVSSRELAQLGLRTEQVIDFSASLNPLGPSPLALAALRDIDPGRYPQDGAPELTELLSQRLGVSPAQIVVGNGSIELLYLLALTYLGEGATVLVVTPTFGEYARVVAILGGQVHTFATDSAQGFAPDVPALLQRIQALQPTLTFVCNPNNPTGWLLDASTVRQLAAAHTHGLLVVDEAYLPFVPGAHELAAETNALPLVLVRSLTKLHGLAGLRLGYVVASGEVSQALHSVRPPWSVNVAAQAAGIAALRDERHLSHSRAVVAEGRRVLLAGLARLGVPVVAGPTSFMLLRTGDSPDMRQRLLRLGVCVRDCTSFGLPEHVRVGIRTPADNDILLHAVEHVLAEQSPT
jgi:histidinol-phosphate aminotransferase